MKFRVILTLAALLLLSACSLPAVPQLPGALPAPSPMPTATPAPTDPPTPTPTTPAALRLDQPPPSQTAPATPPATPGVDPVPQTPVPVPITPENATRLRPVAIYPLFRRGLLRQVLWTPDSAGLVVETSLGLQVLSAPGMEKRFSLPDLHALYFLKDGNLLVLDQDLGLARLDLESGSMRAIAVTLPENNAPYALSPDGSVWVTASGSRTLSVERAEGGAALASVPLSSKTNIAFAIDGLTFSAGGSRLFAHLKRIDGETELVAVDTATWTQVYEVFNADGTPTFSAGDERMLYVSGDRVNVDAVKDGANWNNLALRTVKKISNDQQSVLEAQTYAFTTDLDTIGVLYNSELRDSQALEMKYQPAVLMLYNTRTAQAVRYINNLPMRVSGFAFSPDGKLFFTTARDGILRLHDSQNGALVEASEPFDMDPQPAVRADGGLVAYAMPDHIEVLDPATSKVVAVLGDYPGATHLQARFIGDNDLAVLVETPYRTYIDSYAINARKFLFRYDDLSGCDFNRAGSLMSCFDGVRKIFDMPSGRMLLDLVPQGRQYAAMSDSGARVAACTGGSEFIFIWDARLGSIPKVTLIGTPDVCGPLVFTPDGQTLVSASGYAWDIPSGKIQATFLATSGAPLAVSADGRLLLAYPDLIDLENGRAVGAIQTVPDPQAAFFQPDGATLVLQTRRGLEIWAVGE